MKKKKTNLTMMSLCIFGTLIILLSGCGSNDSIVGKQSPDAAMAETKPMKIGEVKDGKFILTTDVCEMKFLEKLKPACNTGSIVAIPNSDTTDSNAIQSYSITFRTLTSVETHYVIVERKGDDFFLGLSEPEREIIICKNSTCKQDVGCSLTQVKASEGYIHQCVCGTGNYQHGTCSQIVIQADSPF